MEQRQTINIPPCYGLGSEGLYVNLSHIPVEIFNEIKKACIIVSNNRKYMFEHNRQPSVKQRRKLSPVITFEPAPSPDVPDQNPDKNEEKCV